MENILSDTSKFQRINNDIHKTVLSLEEKLNRVLRPIREKLGEAVYDTIRASGSVPGIMYGLVKIHKDGNPLIPIVSSINTFNYNLLRYIYYTTELYIFNILLDT